MTRVKQLFQETTVKLIKTLEEVAESSTIEPYIKNGVITQIEQKVMSTLRKSITGSFATKIELFFKELFKQTSDVQVESISFYKEAANHKSGLIEVQLNNQEKILKDVREI